jgi:adenylate cyclase, class 2
MNVIEVERKRELPDGVENVKERLARFGYREGGSNVEVDTYYSRPDRDFMTTVECLRVRQRDGFAEVTYKPASDATTHSSDDIIAKQETNVVLAGADQATAANTLLAVLGMVQLCRVEKTRLSYKRAVQPGITVALDQIAGVGSFVETEVIAIDRAKAALLLDEVEQQLGLAKYRAVKLPYRDLVLQHELNR